MTCFSHALVKPPGRSFASGLTSANEGPPDYDKALAQHASYCEALAKCGLKITRIAADEAFPDGTFVEDAALVTARGAVLTLPGAPSRRGETDSLAPALIAFFAKLERIALPGTLDGGDVAQAGEHFFIGQSARTNAEGAAQLQAQLRAWDFSSTVVDMRTTPQLLHLKSGISYLGNGTWAVMQGLDEIATVLGIKSSAAVVCVDAEEGYAANCVRINDRVLVAGGYPRFTAALRARGFLPLEVDVSEFRKMDGGLSCLSLRF